MKIKQVVPVFAAFAVLAMPVVASAAVNSANTTINATVNEVISITTTSPVAISLTPTAGGVVSSSSDTVTVATNRTTGYNLTLADSDATTTLVSGVNTFAAHAGTFAAPTALANNTWGYRIVNVGGFGATAYTLETNNGTSTSTWAGVPANASPTTVKTTAAATAGDVTTVFYGAKATSAQPNGVYADTVTYTATTN